MDSIKEVAHTGTVKSVEDKGIKVSITVLSGCASCNIKGVCNMSEQADKEIEIECEPIQFKVGQEVEIRMKESLGFHALFLGYVLPFILMIIILSISSFLSANEAIVGLLSIGSLVPYYSLLYLFRNRIKKKFSYVVNPLNF
jgi:sigma-E factor negative regulatory protein RseC